MTAPHPIQYVKGVGPRLAEKLASRGIRTAQDALYFFPKGYETAGGWFPYGSFPRG